MQSLVILAPTWVGDAVMAQPAIADLSRAPGGTTITVVAGRAVAPVFTMMPEVRETVAVDRSGVLAALRNVGGRSRCDAVLLLPNSWRAALTAYRAGIRERWGYGTDLRSALLTRAVAPPPAVHQVDAYRHLVHALGFPSGAAEPSLPVSVDLKASGARELLGAGWDGRAPLVAMAPGAAYGEAKRWPAASFAELAGTFGRSGVATVLVGGPGDVPVAQQIINAMGSAGTVIDLVGKNDVREMAGVLANCRALVSNDSGAMHLGAAVGVAVTALFGPTDERLTRPRAAGNAVLTNEVWCRPCMLRECPLDHRCMRGIPVAAVAEAARRWI